MKFISPLVAILGSLALTIAAPTAPNDMITMQQTFHSIFEGVDKSVADIRKFNGDSAGIQRIVSDLSALAKVTKDGGNKLKATKAMSIPDLLTILGPASVMENMLGEVVDALSKRKTDLVKAGAKPQILEQLTGLKNSAEVLGQAVVSNLPLAGIIGIIGNPIASYVTARLTAGIQEWTAAA